MKVIHANREVKLDKEQVKLFRAMTPLQQSVVRGVLRGLSYADAYRESNGKANGDESARSIVTKMFVNDSVVNFMNAFNETIDKLVANDLGEAIMSRDEMARSLSDIARSNLGDVVDLFPAEYDDDGSLIRPATWSLKNPEDMTGAGLNLIEELTRTKDGVRIKSHSRLSAMKQLSELLGYDDPKRVALSGEIDNPSQIQIVAPGHDSKAD